MEREGAPVATPKKAPGTLDKVGRRSIYDEKHHPNTAMMLRATGFTEEQIAGIIGIGIATLNVWKKQHPEFREAIKMTPAEANGKVKASLYKQALGYEVEEVKTAIIKNADGTQSTKVEKIKKHIQPSSTATIFWLKNKCPDEFKDVSDMRHSGGLTVKEDSPNARNIKAILEESPEAREALRGAFEKLFPARK